MWANYYTIRWDNFIQFSSYALSHPFVQCLEDPRIVFTQPTESSYTRHRQLTQLIDVVILDAATLQYHPRAVAASALYVVLALSCELASREEIAAVFCRGSQFLNALHSFNEVFGYFVESEFGLCLQELLPAIQYVSTFMSLPFDYQLPENETGAGYNFEELISLQTHNPLQLEYIQAKMHHSQ